MRRHGIALLTHAASGAAVASAPDCPPKITSVDTNATLSNNRRFQVPDAGTDPELIHEPLGDVDGDGKPDHTMRSASGNVGGSSNRGVIYVVMSRFSHAQTPGGSVLKDMDPTQHLPDGVLAIYGAQSLGFAEVQAGNFSDGPSVDLLIRDEDEGVFVVLDVAALLSDSSRSRAVELDPANLPPYIFGAVGAGAKRGGKRVSRVSLNATLDALLVESDSLASGRGGVFFVKIPTVVPHESGSTHPAIVLDRSVHAPGVFGFVGISTDVKLAHGPTLWGSIFHGSTGLDLVLQSSKTTLSLPGGVLKSQAGAVFLVKWDLIAQLATEEDVVEIDPAALPKQTLAFGAGAQDDKLGEGGVTLELLDDDDLLDVVVRTPSFNSDSASNVGAVAALCSRGLPDPPTESGSTISIISASEALPGVLLLLGSGDQGSLGQEEHLIAALGEGGARALVLSYPNLLLGTADAAVGGVFVIHPAVLNDLESGSNIVFQSASLPAGVTGFLGAESQGAVLRLERVHDFGDGPRLIMSTPFEAAGTSATPGAVYIAEVPSIAGGEQGDSPVQLDHESGTAGIATFVLPVADDASEIEYTLDVAFLGSPGQTALVLGPSELDDEARNKAGGVYILHPALIEGSMGAVVTVDGTDSQSGLVRIVGAAEDAYLAGRSFQVADVDGNGANDLVLLSPDFARRRGALEDESPAGSIVLVHDSLLGPEEDTVHVPIDLDDLPNGVMVLVGSCEESEMGSGQIDVTSFAASAVPRFIASAPGSNCMASQDGGDDRGAVYIVDAGAGGLNFGPASASTVFLEAGSLPAGVVGIFGGQDYLRVGDQAPVVGDVGGSAELDLLLPMMDFTPELLGEEIEGAGAVAVFLDPLLHSSESAPAHALGMDSMPDGSYLLVASTESENLGRDVRTEGKQVAITSDHGVNVLDFTLSHSWLASLSVNEPLADEAPSPLEDSPPGQVVARLTALDDDFASASDVPQLNLISTIEALNDEGALAIPTVQTAVEVPEAGTATFTLSLPSGVSYKLLASAMAGSDAEPVNATLLATLRAGSRPDLDLQLAARLCDQAVPRTVPVPLAVREAAGPITVDAFAEGSRDHYITVLEGEPTVNATFDVVLRDGSIQHQADALKARIVVTSTDPMWDPLKDSDDVLQPGSSALGITIGTPAVVAGSATYTVTVATTNLDYEALAGALADFTTSSAPDIVLDFVVQFEVLPGVWGAASEPATLTLSNAVEPPASITGSDIAVTENVEEEFPGAVSYPMVSVWDSIGLTFHVISTIDSNNTGSTMADGRRALDVSLVAMTASEVTTSSASISAGAIDTEALQAHAGVNLMAPDHPETFFFPIKFVACGPSSCVESQQHDLIVTDVVEPELEIESFPQSLTYTIDEATLGPVTPVVQDFYIRLHDLNRPGNLLDFTLTLAGPSGGTVPEPLQGLTASCGTFTHTSANAYVEATCSIDTADASWDLEALRLAVEGTVTSPSPLTGQHYSVEGALGEAPLRVVVSSSIPEQDNAQGPAYDVLVADMDEDPLELALDEAELFTCLEGVDTAQIMMVVPGYDPDFSLETVDGFGTFSVRPEDVTITTSFGSTSLPTLTTTAEVTGPHDISNKGTRFNVVILCGAHLDFEALVAASSQSPSAGLLHLPTLSHDLTVPLYDYIGGGVIQPIVTTVTGGQFGDVNEEPIPSGALRSRAFTVVENGDPGAPLGQLTAFHVDEGDSLSSVVVHSAGDSLAAELTSAGVWALLAVKGFDYEATSPWQGGAAGHQERRLPVAFNVNDPCGAVSVPGAATADFSNNDTYMGANQVPPNISHAAAPTPPEGSRVVPFCVELTDDGDNLDAAGGAKTTLVPAYLYILDANDPPKLANTNPDPEGEPTYTDHFMLAENSDVGVPFGVIRVADEDGDELSSIQVLGMGSEHFEFVHTGTVWRIHAKTSFDFENPPARSDGSERSNTWELLVLLTDSPAEETPASQGVLVTVTIEDVNEAPTYTGPSTFTVEENSAVGTVVGALTFTDPEGHAVTATLSPASAPFALVATGTGYDLTTAGVLDWESGTTQYTLTLSGQDAGSPAQPVSASMVVNVANVEEAAPSPAAPAAAATSKAKKDGNLIATGIGVALVAALVVVVIIFLAYRAGHCSGCTRGYTNMDTEGRAEPSATAPERDRSDSAVAWA